MKKFIQKHKTKLIIGAVILCLVAGWYYYNFTAWERDLTVRYVGRDWEHFKPHDLYEITNNTNKPIKDVVAIFKYKEYIPGPLMGTNKIRTLKRGMFDIPPHGTEELRIYEDCATLKRIKYKR